MTKKRGILSLGIILFVLFSFPGFTAEEQEQQLVIIVHEDVEDSLTKEDIKSIFLGRKTRWTNDEKITFVVYTEEMVYKTFLKDYVGKTIFQYRNYWKKQVFTGKGRMPGMLKTSEEVITFVSETKGAMSFVMADDVKTDTVKVISFEQGGGE